jgi:hypothetical protein
MAILLTEVDTLILHIPKCAGTWIKYAVNKLEIPHAQAVAVGGQCPQHGLKNNYKAATKTAVFVRHPVKWIESWWRFHVDFTWFAQLSQSSHPYTIPWLSDWAELMPKYGHDFNSLVKQVLKTHPGIVSDLFKLYTDGADYIGHVETLEHDVSSLTGCSQHRLEYCSYQNVSRPDRKVVWESGLKAEWCKAERNCIQQYYRGCDHET